MKAIKPKPNVLPTQTDTSNGKCPQKRRPRGAHVWKPPAAADRGAVAGVVSSCFKNEARGTPLDAPSGPAGRAVRVAVRLLATVERLSVLTVDLSESIESMGTEFHTFPEAGTSSAL